jgi:phosphatidylglycerol:prolipoprotein diacylglycerol transferase
VALVCARAYYVIFNLSLYRSAEGGLEWGRVIAVWDGGLAIYGGIIGGLGAAYLVSKFKHIKPAAMLDLGSMGLLIGQAIGRWGNLINREAFGTVTTLPWRMRLYQSLDAYVDVHPTFLYESLWNILGFVLIALFSRRKRSFDGQIFLLYIAWYGFGRGLIESLRTDSLMLFGSETIRVSQLLGFLSCIVAVALLIYFTQVKPQDPAAMFVNRVAAAAAVPDEMPAEAVSEIAAEPKQEAPAGEQPEAEEGGPDEPENKTETDA